MEGVKVAKIDKNELTKEMVHKALQCKTAEKLLKLAEAEDYEMTREEAEAYIAELADFELEEEVLERAAGGSCYTNMTCDDNECNPAHPRCFTGNSEVAVPGGIKHIKNLQVGDKVITLDAEGNEIVGEIMEVMPPQEEEIVEVLFSDGTLWRATASQTLYLDHERQYMVKDAKGKEALLRGGGKAVSEPADSPTKVTERQVMDAILAAGIPPLEAIKKREFSSRKRRKRRSKDKEVLFGGKAIEKGRTDEGHGEAGAEMQEHRRASRAGEEPKLRNDAGGGRGVYGRDQRLPAG